MRATVRANGDKLSRRVDGPQKRRVISRLMRNAQPLRSDPARCAAALLVEPEVDAAIDSGIVDVGRDVPEPRVLAARQSQLTI